MQTSSGVFRNDGDDGDRNDGDDGDDGDRGSGSGILSYTGTRTNALLTQALWRTRADLVRSVDGIGHPTPKMEAPIGPDKAFAQWSRDVRAYQYSFELLSGLHFDKSETGVARLYSMRTAFDKTTKKITGEATPINTLERPAYDRDDAALADELTNVLSMARLRPDRTPEILMQVNVPYSFFAMVLNLQPGRHRYTFDLMSTVFRFSSTVVMQFKHHLRARRPADRSALVQPMLLTPGHGSYPAGHATQCSFVAEVLWALVKTRLAPDVKDQLDQLAARIAENRIVAGLHYPSDNLAGADLGVSLAKYFNDKCGADESALKWLRTRAAQEWE